MPTTGNWPPTTSLSERQRQRLLIWAEMALQRQVAPLNLPEAEMAQVIADKETAVTLIITGVDDLIAELHEPVNDIVDDGLIRLFKNLAWLTGHPAPYAHRHFVKQFRLARMTNNPEEAFRNLFQAIVVSSVAPHA
ncbi:MAG: hypothetical protein KC413_06720 [Anaerolineales bacterium]|nr:hypothetical protein [Anaerolineales bacterium]MCA9975423.1 hypothetical protein [Anaerolineales bacterium]MCB8967681.1 hypothetical protein [Ardenticatenaceae bacterium]